MTTRWDPTQHPRGTGGRFALVGGLSPSGRGLPSNLRGLQENYREIDPDEIATGRGRGDAISRAYHSGKLWDGEPLSRVDAATKRDLTAYQLSPDINESLRGGDDFGEDVARIDAAIERNRLRQDTIVYRGVASEVTTDLRPGDQFVDQGYSSTSLDPSITREFGDDMLEIELPEGTAAAPLSRLGADEWGHQTELLVGRNAVIEIDEIVPTDRPGVFDPSSNQRVIRGRLVGYADTKPQAPSKFGPKTREQVGSTSIETRQRTDIVGYNYDPVTKRVTTPVIPTIEVTDVQTHSGSRGQGSGRRAMEQVLARADANGETVILVPEPQDRQTSKKQLEQFYASLGFVPNKGRTANSRIGKQFWYRRPGGTA